MYYVDLKRFDDFMDALEYIRFEKIEAVICYYYGASWHVWDDGCLEIASVYENQH